jgi:hypothetical protein
VVAAAPLAGAGAAVSAAARGWPLAPNARRVALAAAAAAALAYQVQLPMRVRPGAALAERLLAGVYGREGELRWTRGRARIVFPDPGPGVAVEVAVDLSGWRPRGLEPPWTTLSAGGAGFSGRPAARGETFRVETRTSGLWRSDLTAEIEAETFVPGAHDPRELGVRIREARLVPRGSAVAPRRPSLRALALSAACAYLIYGLLTAAGLAGEAARRAGLGAGVAIGLAYTFARGPAALLHGPLVALLAAVTLLAHVLPRPARAAAGLLASAAAALRRGVGALGLAGAAALFALAAAGMLVAQRARPAVVVDVGSGREAGVASGFGAFDAAEGRTFRVPARNALIDFSDFGGGAGWTLSLTASVPEGRRQLLLARVGDAGLLAALEPRWVTGVMPAPAPFAWRAGLRVEFPTGGDAPPIRLDRVEVDRGRSWPAPRAVSFVLLAGLMTAIGVGATGVPRGGALAAGGLAVLGIVTAVALDALVAIPFLATLAGIAAAGAALSSLLAAVSRAGGTDPALPPAAVAALGLGFVGWLAATAWPAYRGGHFIFHSNIAEEIWKGQFLLYYLPYPGSMLSQQAQWGQIIVPHPCLEQTLMAPLASLPREAFHLAEKAVLAAWLAAAAGVAALLARRLAGPRAATFTAVVAALLVPGYQLLGLGHLMTILGCLGGAAALGFLALRVDQLAGRGPFWALVGLLSFAMLSYFATLLFTGLATLLATAWLWPRDRSLARRLLLASTAAALVAFALYYVHWAWPFLSQSAPRILGGAASSKAESGTQLLTRLALLPRKLDYSYGAWLVPASGLLGLGLAPRGRSRLVLACWGAVLIVVSALDLWFNFLLKHHYFVMAPVALGWGLFLARLWDAGRAGRVCAVLLVLLLSGLGLETAIAVATGRIP